MSEWLPQNNSTSPVFRPGQAGMPTGYPPPLRSFNRTVLWIVLGVFGSIFLIGSIAIGVLWSFEQQGRAAQEAFPLKHGQPIPGQLIGELQEFKSVPSKSEIEELEKFIQSLQGSSTDVDSDQFTRVMAASRISPEVNWITRKLIAVTIQNDFQPPSFSEFTRILRVDWMKPDQQARVFLVNLVPSDQEPEMYVVWVKKDDKGNWKLYDWKEWGHADTEAEFYALVFRQAESRQDAYANLSVALSDHYSSKQNHSPADGAELADIYRRNPQPPDLQNTALTLLARYHEIYGDLDGLQQVADKLNPVAAPIAYYYKAKARNQADNHGPAISELKRFVSTVGWHPSAALMAAELAESEADKEWATQLLLPLICLSPSYYPSQRVFNRLATPAACDKLVAELERFQCREEQVLDLLESFLWSDETRAMLATAFEKNPKFEVISLLAQASHLSSDANPIEAATKLQGIFKSESNSELIAMVSKRLALLAAENASIFDSTLKLVPEPVTFLEDVRDRLLTGYGEKLVLKEFVEACNARQNLVEPLIEEPHTQAVYALYENQQKQYASVFERCIQLPTTDAFQVEEIDGQYRSGYGYSAFHSLAEAAAKLGRASELLEHFKDTDYALDLALSGLKLPEDLEQYDAILAKYTASSNKSGSSNDEDACLHFHAAISSHFHKNWEKADDELGKAIDIASNTQLNSDGSEREDGCAFAPFDDDAESEWADVRVRVARIHNRVADLLQKKDLTSSTLLALSTQLKQWDDEELHQRVGKILTERPEDYTRLEGFQVLGRSAEKRKEWAEAARHYLAAAEEGFQLQYDYAWQAAIAEAIRSAIRSKDSSVYQAILRTLETHGDRKSTDWYSRAAKAMARSNSTELRELIDISSEQGPSVPHSLRSWHEMVREMNCLRDLQRKSPRYLSEFDCDSELLLLSNQPMAESIDLVSCFSKLETELGPLEQVVQLPREKFDNVDWIERFEFAQGWLIVASLRGPATHVEEMTTFPKDSVLRKEFRTGLCLQWYGKSVQSDRFRPIYRLAQYLVQNNESIFAMANTQANSFLHSGDWKAKLAGAPNDCLDWTSIEAFGYWNYESDSQPAEKKSAAAERQADQPITISHQTGLIIERLQALPLPEETGRGNLVQLQSNSLLSPELQSGDILQDY